MAITVQIWMAVDKMTQQEFEHIYYSIKADLIRLAGQFCRSASPAIESEDLKRSR